MKRKRAALLLAGVMAVSGILGSSVSAQAYSYAYENENGTVTVIWLADSADEDTVTSEGTVSADGIVLADGTVSSEGTVSTEPGMIIIHLAESVSAGANDDTKTEERDSVAERESADGEITYSVAEREMADGKITYVWEGTAEGDAQSTEDSGQVSEESDIAQASEAASLAEADDAAEGDYLEAENKRREEYKAAGIGCDEKNGGWLWDEKPVFWLMDEDGSIYQNNAGKEDKIYILVKRDEDGSILEVKQITAEEVLEERIAQTEE